MLLSLAVTLGAQDLKDTSGENAGEAAQEAAQEHVKDNGVMAKYRRSSLYSVLVTHSGFPYATEIETAFMQMPMPDKFDDHNLGLRKFESSAAKMKKSGKKKDEANFADVQNFIAQNAVGRELVAKWYNRNPLNGGFNMSLIQQRGFYDATQEDIRRAELSERHLALLGDAGEDLISNTFMIVNDITFVDKGEQSAKAATALSIIGGLAGAITGNKSYSDLGKAAAVATNEIDGFSVNVTTYLYRLVWNKDIQDEFYTTLWHSDTNPDPALAATFASKDFTMQYIGKTSISAGNLESKSFSKYTKEQQMLQVCARAVDKSIVELQKEYDEFKVSVPVYEIGPNHTVKVQVGLKEGLNEKSVYDVLLPVENEQGQVRYRVVGSIKPVKGQIWDNRFGALDDAQALIDAGKKHEAYKDGDAFLDATTFKVASGEVFMGCLVRERTIKTNSK